MTDSVTYLSKDKKKALEAELINLKSTKRREILEALEYAKSLGDLSENSEYHQAREEQARLEDRINAVEAILQSAVVVEQHHATSVEIGATITVQRGGTKEKKVFTIVGQEEADMAAGKISHESPLGAALYGKKKGDTASVTTPKGTVEYTILSIE